MVGARRLVPQQLRSVAARYAAPVPGGGTGRALAALGARVRSWQPDAPAATPSAATSRRDERLTRLEAILFLAREPLSTRKLSQYANLADGTEARTLIRQLNERYDQLGRAFRVEEVAGGFQLLTRPKFAKWLRRLEQVPKEIRLSAPALETLAVVAYRQPAGRAEIEAIRGVNCGEILRQLMDRDLIRIAGRSDELGRPYLYATTRRFLQLFGLRNLEELPRAAELKQDSAAPVRHTIPQEINRLIESPERSEEDPQVTATIRSELAPEELHQKSRLGIPSLNLLSLNVVSARDEDEDLVDEDEDDEDEEEDDLEELEDEDEDFEDDEFEDEEGDDEDLEDEDFEEDDEWEEVEDDDEEEDWDEEDDEDDDWDEDEEEEEEEEEWE